MSKTTVRILISLAFLALALHRAFSGVLAHETFNFPMGCYGSAQDSARITATLGCVDTPNGSSYNVGVYNEGGSLLGTAVVTATAGVCSPLTIETVIWGGGLVYKYNGVVRASSSIWTHNYSGGCPFVPQEHQEGVAVAIYLPVLGTVTFSAQLDVPPHSAEHTLGLKVNGVLVDELTSTPDLGTAQTVDLTGTVSNVNTNSSATVEWLVDGFSQGVNPLTFTNIGSAEVPNWQATVGYHGSVSATPMPTATPAATPTPTVGPTAPPHATASPGTTPPLYTVPPSGTNPGGTGNGVVVLNPAAIYQPIVDRLSTSDANRARDVKDGVTNALGTGGASTSAPGTKTFAEADLTERGHLDDLEAKGEEIKTAITDGAADGKTSLEGAAENISGWGTASFGSVTVLPLNLSLIQASWPSSIPLPPWSGLVRTAILWILTALWWMVALKSIIALQPR